ncbi:putative E3 ubiquitin-protein ligase XBAT35 [Vitis vinifera]|uniref:Putative E3 ubiquitin-protein ligase XBAT35 n=1 Tax=Vitis vinifera TaxID=29760 RepID=A0A438DD77_VITVI|nr:putative E3 ubiquitin-protein ligase XBAT35 [Vitis vinifera]
MFQAMHPPAFLHNAQTPAVPPTAPPTAEDLELAMAINASIHWNNSVNITNHNCPDALVAPVAPASSKASSSECVVHEAGPSTNSTQHIQIETHIPDIPVQASTASAPPIADEVVDDAFETSAAASEQSKEGGAASSCVICLDAPIEGACIPCGHMAGCMSCLNEIKAKKWGCPVCRAKIDQVVKLYSV